MAIYEITFMARSGNEDDALVTVNATTDHTGQPCYYASNLALWGCGKNSSTPEGGPRENRPAL